MALLEKKKINKTTTISKILFFIFLIIIQLNFICHCFAKTAKKCIPYKAIKVYDGDTILVESPQWGDSTSIMSHNNVQKIRLLGIDAFELHQNKYGLLGKDFLTKEVLNKTVCVETDVQKNDVYGRTLGYVFIARRLEKPTKQSQIFYVNSMGIATPHSVRLAMTFINEELLKNGYAILSDFPPNIKYINKLKDAQIQGRENMLGVWKENQYVFETPSQWRHKHPFKKQI